MKKTLEKSIEKINPVCDKCALPCKQSVNMVIVQCPKFTKPNNGDGELRC